MEMIYEYRGKRFTDAREAIKNCVLEPDIDTLIREYIPFQIPITGRMPVKGLTVRYRYCFTPQRRTFSGPSGVREALNKYHYYYDMRKYEVAAAVSGGLDSSTVAMICKPKVTYSGFYPEDPDCDETRYANEAARAIGVTHHGIALCEDDFLDNVHDYVRAMVFPMAGLGGVMEFALIRKLKKQVPNLTGIAFGNGGDEIFMGYFWNHYIMSLFNNEASLRSFPGFRPSHVKITNDIIDWVIVSAVNRGNNDALSPFIVTEFLPQLTAFSSAVDKILHVNINMTLVALLHMTNQIALCNGLRPFNPFCNQELFDAAKAIYALQQQMGPLSKPMLRNQELGLPLKIRSNIHKKGFPMPIHRWHRVQKFIIDEADRFMKRRLPGTESFTVKAVPDRFTWGLCQAELFLREVMNT